MDLRGIGVSIIEASVTKLAREVMHVQLRQVRRALTTALKNVILSVKRTELPLHCASRLQCAPHTWSLQTECRRDSCLKFAVDTRGSLPTLHCNLWYCLQVRAEYRLSAANQSVRFALEDLQVDNQLLTSSQPVVLARARGVHRVSSLSNSLRPVSAFYWAARASGVPVPAPPGAARPAVNLPSV